MPYVTTQARATHPVRSSRSATTCAPCRDQISRWVPQRLDSLGTDGFGFADTRAAARRFFQVDAESIVVQALAALAEEGEIARDQVPKAIDVYRIDDPTAVAHVKQEGGDA